MSRPKKCVLCGEVILPTESCVPYKHRYAHSKCFNDAMRTLSNGKKKQLQTAAESKKKKMNKPQAQLKEGMSEEEYAKKKKYYNYLQSLVEDGDLTAKQFAVSEKYIERYNFNFEGMYNTLVYLNEILEKDLTGDVVGIIPYYYNEANQFYEELTAIEVNNTNINLQTLYPTKHVYIKPIKKRFKELDIEEIGVNNDTIYENN